ncbi:peptidase [Streptomyces fumigatiscleroticus]|nr:peptidase [Streptomyces fumigatiscleroticus]
MRPSRRHPLLVPALLCALAVLAARPADVTGGDEGTGGGPGVSAQVARLYEDAALATQRYEAGRRAAGEQRERARRAERLLGHERRRTAVLREDLGRIARAQYRSGGGLPFTAHLIVADDPQQLMHGRQALSRAESAVDRMIGSSRRAEARLAADEARAAAVRQALERRNAELDGLRKSIGRRLAAARSRLQGQADASAAAGTCHGAVRLDQPGTRSTRAWVAPVETYELSAGFGSGGARWADRHTGQDFAVPVGTPVRAAGAGRVVRVSCGGPFGIQIVVRHANGYYTQYGHLAAVAVGQGERVAAGQWIGQSGSTGNSTGPHLHFEVRVTPEAGSAVDPMAWLAARGVPL